MKYDDVKKILAESSQSDWVVDDESGSFTYKEDLNLHIVRAPYETYRDFNEEWATIHPDPNAVSVEFTVKYGNSFVDKQTLVSIDGHRAILPMPTSATDLSVKRSDVNFAKIVDVGSRIDEYIERANLKIKKDEE